MVERLASSSSSNLLLRIVYIIRFARLTAPGRNWPTGVCSFSLCLYLSLIGIVRHLHAFKTSYFLPRSTMFPKISHVLSKQFFFIDKQSYHRELFSLKKDCVKVYLFSIISIAIKRQQLLCHVCKQPTGVFSARGDFQCTFITSYNHLVKVVEGE